MTSVNFEISPELDRALEELVKLTGSNSKSEVLLRSIALMKVAAEAQQKGEKLVITGQDKIPVAEIII
jgi:hypothetical protein